MDVELLQFCIDDRRLGLRAGVVWEVVRSVKLAAPIDDTHRLEGFLRLRGETLPVVNLRRAMGLPDKPIALTDVLIVIEHGEAAYVLRADGGLTTFNAVASSIQTSQHSPMISESVQSGSGVTFLLDVEALAQLAHSESPVLPGSTESGP